MAHYRHRVTPFGNLRIKAHVPLPEAYRSLSRPSSPVGTKASTVCPLKLDSGFEISSAAMVMAAFCRGSLQGSAGLRLKLPLFPPGVLYSPALLPDRAVKILHLGFEYLSKTATMNTRSFCSLVCLFCSQKKLLHMDVKERTAWLPGALPFGGGAHSSFVVQCEFRLRVAVRDGGPDRTRTYDPRLIKAVL